MAKKSKMSVLKRQRERKKAEKAAMKRETRGQKEEKEQSDSDVASAEDLEGYGLGSESSSDGGGEPVWDGERRGAGRYETAQPADRSECG